MLRKEIDQGLVTYLGQAEDRALLPQDAAVTIGSGNMPEWPERVNREEGAVLSLQNRPGKAVQEQPLKLLRYAKLA